MNKQELRIVFMGTPEFAKESLKSLLDNDFKVVGVFCRADKPAGRGNKIKTPEVKLLAKHYKIPIFQPINLKEENKINKILDILQPDLIVVVAYGMILPKYILEYPRLGCINLHASILPKYRGAAPIQWAIINKEKYTGVTTMYMDEGMDTGDIILIEKIPIQSNDTYASLHDKLLKIGSKVLVETIHNISNNVISRKKQTANFSLAPMLTKENTKIDFNKSSDDIISLIKGTNPVPAAWCMLDEKRSFKILSAEEIEYNTNKTVQNGEIVYLNDKKKLFIVKCKNGYINILQLKPAGAKTMTSEEYIRGNKIKAGEIFI